MSTLTCAYFIDITDLRDWYNVTEVQVRENGGTGLFRYGSLTTMLKKAYPERYWKSWRFSRPHNVPKRKTPFSKTQHLLYKQIQNVSSDVKVINKNFVNHS